MITNEKMGSFRCAPKARVTAEEGSAQRSPGEVSRNYRVGTLTKIGVKSWYGDHRPGRCETVTLQPELGVRRIVGDVG